MLVDSHCHIYFPQLKSRLSELLANMSTYDVSHALVVSVNSESFKELLPLVERENRFFASVGEHPVEEHAEEITLEALILAARHPKVVGIGETGLDYYHQKDPVKITAQHDRFMRHIQASNQTGLPLIIHTRSAGQAVLDTLEEYHHQGAVIHCFTEDLAFAKRALEMGYYISFSGIVTFKNARNIQEVARYVPDDRLLVETDAPYLAPVPCRGKVNEPAWVAHTAAFIAELREQTLAHIAKISADNFFTLFNKARLSC